MSHIYKRITGDISILQEYIKMVQRQYIFLTVLYYITHVNIFTPNNTGWNTGAYHFWNGCCEVFVGNEVFEGFAMGSFSSGMVQLQQ